METPEYEMHSFIVKLWLEKSDEEPSKAVWHGYVTHVPDGERRYLRNLRDIAGFIENYVGNIDRVGDIACEETRRSRARLWLKRLMRLQI